MSKVSRFFGGGKDDSARRAAEEARQREAQRQARLAEGRGYIDQAFSQFGDPFYDSRAKAYLDYAEPQLEDQFNRQKQSLIFALSRGGKLNSSVAAERNRRLQEQLELARQGIEATGQNYATDARRSVANARSDLISLLTATEDPAATRDEALRRASLEEQTPGFTPLGSLFSGITEGLSQAAGGPANGYQGLFGSGGGLFQDKRRNQSGFVVG